MEDIALYYFNEHAVTSLFRLLITTYSLCQMATECTRKGIGWLRNNLERVCVIHFILLFQQGLNVSALFNNISHVWSPLSIGTIKYVFYYFSKSALYINIVLPWKVKTDM